MGPCRMDGSSQAARGPLGREGSVAERKRPRAQACPAPGWTAEGQVLGGKMCGGGE